MPDQVSLGGFEFVGGEQANKLPSPSMDGNAAHRMTHAVSLYP